MDGSKFCEQHLKRNIPVKLFQNLTSGLEEDFLRIFSCPYMAGNPYSSEPCLWTDQNFVNSIWKVHPRNIPVKLFQNLTCGLEEEDFLRISSCPYSARSPYSPEPCLWMHQNFANNFWKRSPQEHSCEIFPKSDQLFHIISPVFDGRIKNCLLKLLSTWIGLEFGCLIKD